MPSVDCRFAVLVNRSKKQPHLARPPHYNISVVMSCLELTAARLSGCAYAERYGDFAITLHQNPIAEGYAEVQPPAHYYPWLSFKWDCDWFFTNPYANKRLEMMWLSKASSLVASRRSYTIHAGSFATCQSPATLLHFSCWQQPTIMVLFRVKLRSLVSAQQATLAFALL